MDRRTTVAGKVKALAWLALSVAGFGAEVRVTDRILPLVQDGGGFSTSITIVNLESTTSSFEVLFLSNAGALWEVKVSGPASVISDGAYVRGTLGAGRSVTFQTTGAGSDLGSGHAKLFSLENARLGVDMTVKRDGAAWSFTVCPEREDTLILPFDNTDGAGTSFLWLSDTPFTLVNYRVVAEDGTQLLQGRYQFTLSNSLVQDMFVLADRMPETAGRRGTVELQIDYPNAGIYDELYFTGLAIQTGASGLPVVKPSMSTATWRAARY